MRTYKIQRNLMVVQEVEANSIGEAVLHAEAMGVMCGDAYRLVRTDAEKNKNLPNVYSVELATVKVTEVKNG